jgi:hypothetical protein
MVSFDLISHPIDGQQKFWLLWIGFYLLSDVLYVRVDRPLIALELVTLHLLDYLQAA